MAIIVNSPFSGKPIKVRDQDAGRAVKDEEGRLFYVLPRSDGRGYYGSITRAANTRDEARAAEMESKMAVAKGEAQAEYAGARLAGAGRSRRGKLLVLVLLILFAILAYLAFGPLRQWIVPVTPPPPAPVGTPSGAAPGERSEAPADADAAAGGRAVGVAWLDARWALAREAPGRVGSRARALEQHFAWCLEIFVDGQGRASYSGNGGQMLWLADQRVQAVPDRGGWKVGPVTTPRGA